MSTGCPIEAHVDALGAALHGPPRYRAGLLAEARSGLYDAADALTDAGLRADVARRQAVDDFGSVAELAPRFQAELVAAQGRRTALLLALSFPGLVLGWSLLWSSGAAWPPTVPAVVGTLSLLEDVLGALVGVSALAALVLLRRRDPRPVVAGLVALGTIGAAGCAGLAVAMSALAAHPATGHLTGYVVSAAVLVAALSSLLRTRRLLART